MTLPHSERFTDALFASGRTDVASRCDSLCTGIRIAPSGSTARRFRCATALAALSLALTGCSAAMTSTAASERSNNRYGNSSTEWPLKFKAHYIGVFSYSTYGCQVIYNGRPRLDEPDDVLQISSNSVGSYPENLNASWGPIPNFPPPAKVTWRSKDGTPHEVEIDIGEIFKDQLIRHKLKRDEIAEEGIGPGAIPEIILEVNDRTINVYMRAHISTNELQEPGNRYSGFRNDVIKVYSRTY